MKWSEEHAPNEHCRYNPVPADTQGVRWARRNGRWEQCYITKDHTRVFMRPAPKPQPEPKVGGEPLPMTPLLGWDK